MGLRNYNLTRIVVNRDPLPTPGGAVIGPGITRVVVDADETRRDHQRAALNALRDVPERHCVIDRIIQVDPD